MVKGNETTKYLGKQFSEPIESIDTVDAPSWGDGVVTLECSEFTSHCPVTGQPDFGRVTIRYKPKDKLAETKSLKLYLWRYRNVAMFNEFIAQSIADDFFRDVDPRELMVEVAMNTRGGIALTARIQVNG